MGTDIPESTLVFHMGALKGLKPWPLLGIHPMKQMGIQNYRKGVCTQELSVAGPKQGTSKCGGRARQMAATVAHPHKGVTRPK